MPINCKIMRNSLLKGEAGKVLYPRVIKANTMKSTDFVKMVASGRPMSESSVKSVLASVSETLATCLSNGNSVQIDGLGTFSIAMKGEVKSEGNGKLSLNHAEVNTLNFQPDKIMMNQLKDAEFSLCSDEVFEARALTTQEAVELANKLADEVGQFTRETFAAKAGISYSYAGNLLRTLEEEKLIGVVVFGRTRVYSKV